MYLAIQHTHLRRTLLQPLQNPCTHSSSSPDSELSEFINTHLLNPPGHRARRQLSLTRHRRHLRHPPLHHGRLLPCRRLLRLGFHPLLHLVRRLRLLPHHLPVPFQRGRLRRLGPHHEQGSVDPQPGGHVDRPRLFAAVARHNPSGHLWLVGW